MYRIVRTEQFSANAFLQERAHAALLRTEYARLRAGNPGTLASTP